MQGLIIFMKKIIAVNQRKISKMADFVTKKCKKQPFREKRAGQKKRKKRAQQGHTEKIALEQKKGEKKKKSRGMPFFFDRKKGRP